MNMLDRLHDYIADNGLSAGWIFQDELWRDSGKATDRYIVIQSNGGTQVRDGLANDFYFSLYVVGKKGQENLLETKTKVDEIVDFIKNNPLDSCLNYIQLQSPVTRPVLSEENRVMYELMLRVVWGE